MKIAQYYQKDRYQYEMIQWRREHYYPFRLSIFLKKLNFKLKGKILDAGCGDGGLAKEIVVRFNKAKVYGVDISKEGCKLARKYCVETKVTDLNKRIPYPDNYFDFIISQEVLEHIIDTDRYFEEFHRVLKKGGKVIITTPNLLAWHQRMLCFFGIVPTFYELSTTDKSIGLGILKKILYNKQPVGHVRVFTKMALVDIAKLYKFKVLAIKGTNIEFKLPPPFQEIYKILDYLFSLTPSLASNLILYMKKV